MRQRGKDRKDRKDQGLVRVWFLVSHPRQGRRGHGKTGSGYMQKPYSDQSYTTRILQTLETEHERQPWSINVTRVKHSETDKY